jgi:predicted nucleic acid-binding protein
MSCASSSGAARWCFLAGALWGSIRSRRERCGAPRSARPSRSARPLLPGEVAHLIRQRLRRGQGQLDDARALPAQFLTLPIRLQAPEALYDRALVLADEHHLPAVCDAHDGALAGLLGATRWTAGRRLPRALDGRLPFVRWIAGYGS